jgi:cytochrome c-type biogenesis protein CcmH/NrfG
MKKDSLLVGGVALIVGLLLGLLIGQKSGGPAPAQVNRPAPGPAPTVNLQQKTNELKGIVAADPTNRQAWVALGNEYFDSNQFMEAIDAYDKALEIEPNDPNVLTDQGVMFRRLGWFDRAIDNFTRASEAQPGHATSLYNLGVVYRYDLQDFAMAEKVWARFLEVAPPGPGTDQVRQEMEFFKTHPPMPKPQ